MHVIRLINRIKSGEGLELEVYPDHLGVWTIGWGTTHFLGESVTEDWPNITPKRAREMLYLEIMVSIVAATNSVTNFQQIGGIRQEALTELVYQLGRAGWRRFKKTRAFIEQSRFEEASVEIKDSALWRDPKTRRRCNRYAKMLLLGDDYV